MGKTKHDEPELAYSWSNSYWILGVVKPDPLSEVLKADFILEVLQ